ncbi:hypothetical protein KM043_001879 [Ampulex compressa]|nr:hypothetical protein KM043_001879 [Ampulex compressa]
MDTDDKSDLDLACDRNSDDEMVYSTAEEQDDRRFQKESIHIRLLPYHQDLETESEALLAQIKGHLGQAVLLREIEPGFHTWMVRLRSYIRLYGLRFSKEDHILFIKLIYELITAPNLDTCMIQIDPSLLIELLKRQELISPDELQLPWRPLYELTRRIRKSKKVTMGMIRYSLELPNVLCNLAHVAKPYFPINATQEILDELRPMLCPYDNGTMIEAVEALEWYLPVTLRQEHHSFGYQLWFEEFMTLWTTCYNAPHWEHSMMWLMARTAMHNIGYIDWEPYIPTMFTRFLRSFDLPVIYKNIRDKKHYKLNNVSIAIWITSVLGGGSSAQMYLNKILKTIETYLHPANHGLWVIKLKDLLVKLSHHFNQRLQRERYKKPSWETRTPDNYKLTDDDIDAFVKAMAPVVMTAMFNKARLQDVSEALQCLASMRPNLVIPDILDRMYSSLDSLTEPHKLTSSMFCMIAVVRPMVEGSRNTNKGFEYASGPSHVLPMLFSCLPGIDANDIGKCFATLQFLSAYISLIPIVDSSRSNATMNEEERMISRTTAQFEDFVVQFLDRMFILVDSSSLDFVAQESRTNSLESSLERGVSSTLAKVFRNILSQMSDAIFKVALHKLHRFVAERIFETKVAGQLAGTLCEAFARTNAEETLRVFIPMLAETILEIIGEGEDVLKEENLENRLLYAMLLLCSVVPTRGDSLMPHIQTLQKILDRALLLKSNEGSRLGIQLLACICHALSSIRPYRYRTVERDYNDPNYSYVRDWGQFVHIDDLKMEWYMPGKPEIDVLQNMFYRYVIPELEKLKQYCHNSDTLSRDELFTSLRIVSATIEGCDALLPLWVEPPLVLVESALDTVVLTLTLGVKGEITMPDGSNVRRYLTMLMSDLQKTMLENAEDDTKSLCVLAQIFNCLLLGKFRSCQDHEMKCKSFKVIQNYLKNKMGRKKGYIPSLTLQRADILHNDRVHCESFYMTETHKRIMIDLVTLATSRYPNVRSMAQEVLFSAISHYPFSYPVIVPYLLEILAKDTEEHHDAYKGVLYILFGPVHHPFIVRRDWKLLRSLWPAIILAKTAEKPSVIRLRDNLEQTIPKYYPTLFFEFEIPDACFKIASDLWRTFPQSSVARPNESEIEEGLQKFRRTSKSNLQAYNDLVNDLLNALEKKNLHWRHRLMAMNFLQYLVHPEQNYSPNVVRFFLDVLVNGSLKERKIALTVMVYIMKQQNRKNPKVTIDVPSAKKMNMMQMSQSERLVPGIRPDNSWLLYDYNTRPLNAKQWNEPRFIHKPYVGYYAWPKKLEVCAPCTERPGAEETLTPCGKEIHIFFNDPMNIEKMINVFSLEEKKGKDKFESFRYLLFKNLFRNHGDMHLKHFLPHLQKLVMDKQESSQRCAAEIMAGVVRGATYWPFEMTRDMWESLLPIIRNALSNVTDETLCDWCTSFALMHSQVDPNRQHWFLECLMEEPHLGETETSFLKCARLHVVQAVLNRQCWRLPRLQQHLLNYVECNVFTNPFENLRERMGKILVTVFNANLKFGDAEGMQVTPKAQDFVDKIMPKLQFLMEDAMGELSVEERLMSMQMCNVKFDNSPEDVTPEDLHQRTVPIRLLKTICNWIAISIFHSEQPTLALFYKLFPVICHMENCETDMELTKTCSRTLGILAQAFTLSCDMQVALDAITNVSKSTSWWARFTSLEFLQVFVFHNMSIILGSSAWVDCVKDIVLRLLEDERLEVRNKSGQVLGGLLHCMFIPEQEGLLEVFKKKASTKLHRINNMIPSTNKETNGNAEAVRIRHAGVLGLCAFVQAHPYDVPKYLPHIFEYLSLNLNDPEPIPTTIRKTLSSFNRTHYIGWTGINGHAEHFTEAQLAILEDLSVPPAHYA